MADYEVSGNEKSGNKDSSTYLALFSGCDPVRFEDAYKDVKWQKAMDVEIAAIEKNNKSLQIFQKAKDRLALTGFIKLNSMSVVKLISTRHAWW